MKTEEIKGIILDDGRHFSYTIRQVKITNALGAAVGVLDEYFITNSAGENYKLYKTSEGNWYDMPEANDGADKSILLSLKFGIDNNQ